MIFKWYGGEKVTDNFDHEPQEQIDETVRSEMNSYDINGNKKKYDLTWPNFLLFILLFLGVSVVIGVIIGIYGAIYGEMYFVKMLTTGYIGLILDAAIFLIAFLVLRPVRKFTVKVLDLSPLGKISTYGYVLLGFVLFFLANYIFIDIFKVENPSAQQQQLGLANVKTVLQYLLIFASVGIITPIKEEILYRGILHRFLETRHNFWIGLIISSAIFGLAHLTGGIFIIPTIMGVIFVLLYKKTNSIIPGMLLHALWNLFSLVLSFFI